MNRGAFMERKYDKIYMCIDLKSFFASVECADMGLDPFTPNLAVADPSRGNGAICPAITPAMKAPGTRLQLAPAAAFSRFRRVWSTSRQCRA